jgi:large subunit ribosomal protein L4
MREAPLFSATGSRAASFVLPQPFFDGTVNEPVLHQAVKTYLNNQRQGTAQTKIRKYVTGGNQKPWRQKGTGRARQGSTRAPHWRGGGTVFGPIPRDYRSGIPVQVRQLARRSAFNARAAEGALVVIEELSFDAPKTSRLAGLIAQVGGAGKNVLVLTNGAKTNVYLSGRNLPDAQVLPYTDATAYHVLWADVVVVEQAALGGGEATAGEAPAAKGEGRKAKGTAKAAPRKAKASAKTSTVERRPKTAAKAAPKKASRKKESE